MHRSGIRTTSKLIVVLLVAVALVAVACTTTSADDDASRITVGSASETDISTDAVPTPLVEAASVNVGEVCAPMSSAEAVARSVVSEAELQAELPLMKALHLDIVLIWERFDIQPNTIVIDGLPTITIWTADLENNCADIVSAVARPDRIRVIEWDEGDFSLIGGQTPWRTLIETDLALAGNEAGGLVWSSIGNALHQVTSVDLRADQQELADQLVRDYGPLVNVSLGGFDIDVAPNPADRSRCRTIPNQTAPDVTVDSIDWDGDPWDGQLTVTIRNNRDTTVHLVPQRIAETTTPFSNELESAFPGAMTMEARGSIEVLPGETTTLRVPVSTSSCTNVELPPGDYDLVLPVAVHNRQSFEGEPADEHVIARLPINLT